MRHQALYERPVAQSRTVGKKQVGRGFERIQVQTPLREKKVKKRQLFGGSPRGARNHETAPQSCDALQ